MTGTGEIARPCPRRIHLPCRLQSTVALAGAGDGSVVDKDDHLVVEHPGAWGVHEHIEAAEGCVQSCDGVEGVDECVYAPCEHPELTGEKLANSRELEVDNFPGGGVGISVIESLNSRCTVNMSIADFREGVWVA